MGSIVLASAGGVWPAAAGVRAQTAASVSRLRAGMADLTTGGAKLRRTIIGKPSFVQRIPTATMETARAVPRDRLLPTADSSKVEGWRKTPGFRTRATGPGHYRVKARRRRRWQRPNSGR